MLEGVSNEGVGFGCGTSDSLLEPHSLCTAYRTVVGSGVYIEMWRMFLGSEVHDQVQTLTSQE